LDFPIEESTAKPVHWDLFKLDSQQYRDETQLPKNSRMIIDCAAGFCRDSETVISNMRDAQRDLFGMKPKLLIIKQKPILMFSQGFGAIFGSISISKQQILF
jgi:hypothetical protein